MSCLRHAVCWHGLKSPPRIHFCGAQLVGCQRRGMYGLSFLSLRRHVFLEQRVKRCGEWRGDTKSIESRRPAVAAAAARWNCCQRGSGEWVAGGLAPGTPNEESLPACLSIWPHQLIWSLPDWQTTGRGGALMGTWGHTYKQNRNFLLNVCVCAWN